MLDAISSVVSAVAAQSVTAKDEAQTKNTNTASKKQDAKTDKSDAKTAGFSDEAAVYEKSDSKDDSKDTAKSTVNQKMSKADRDARQTAAAYRDRQKVHDRTGFNLG